jgi:hypothetical protein
MPVPPELPALPDVPVLPGVPMLPDVPVPPDVPMLPVPMLPDVPEPAEPFFDFDFEPGAVEPLFEDWEPPVVAEPEPIEPEPVPIEPEPEPVPIDPAPAPGPDVVLSVEPLPPVVPAPPAPDPPAPPDCARAAVEPSRTIEIAKAFSMSRLLITARSTAEVASWVRDKHPNLFE